MRGLVVGFIAGLGLAALAGAEAPPAYTLISSRQCARLGESVPLNLGGFPDGAGLSVEWKASKGKIEGQGLKAAFTPTQTGWAIVDAAVRQNGNLVWEHKLPLLGFNQFVIFKADDLCQGKVGEIHDVWTRYFLYMATERIKTSVGVITMCFNLWNDKTIQYLRQINNTGMVEFFYHGWDHANPKTATACHWDTAEPVRLAMNGPLLEPLLVQSLYGALETVPKFVPEYKGIPARGIQFFEHGGTTYEYQKQHLEDGIKACKDKLGITIRTFGAPSNRTDAITQRVLDENPDICGVFFAPPDTKKVFIEHYADIEPEKGLPNFEFLKTNMEANRDKEVIALQMHPQQAAFNQDFNDQFVPCVNYLKTLDATFITAKDYTLYKTKGLAPVNPLEDSDNDGLSDGDEPDSDPDGDGLPCFLDPDSNNNGIADGDEKKHGKDPYFIALKPVEPQQVVLPTAPVPSPSAALAAPASVPEPPVALPPDDDDDDGVSLWLLGGGAVVFTGLLGGGWYLRRQFLRR